MTKNKLLETTYEKFLRTRADEICQMYLGWSDVIQRGEVKPHRIIRHIAMDKSMTPMGVKSILQRRGIYKNASQPIVQS